LRQHRSIRPWSEHVEVHWSEVGEAYVTPVSADVVGVAILTDRTARYGELLASFPALLERLDGAPAVSRVMGAGPFRQRVTRRAAGRVLLVGDASGYVDALTGEGIAMGLAQAREAVRAITADDPGAYERHWRQVTWRSAALTHVLVQATRSRHGRRLIVPAADRLPGVFGWAVAELTRPL
jgi:flavin-dependent dehydrogenase